MYRVDSTWLLKDRRARAAVTAPFNRPQRVTDRTSFHTLLEERHYPALKLIWAKLSRVVAGEADPSIGVMQ